jgi:hypothetical protein
VSSFLPCVYLLCHLNFLHGIDIHKRHKREYYWSTCYWSPADARERSRRCQQRRFPP